MATKTSSADLTNLVINKVESTQVFRTMVNGGLINENELYLVAGDDTVTYSLVQNGSVVSLVGSDGSTSTITVVAGTPLVAGTASEMSDTTRIYIYQGNETGYTSGDWYYYNGSAWVSGGQYIGSGVDVATPTETLYYLGVVTNINDES